MTMPRPVRFRFCHVTPLVLAGAMLACGPAHLFAKDAAEPEKKDADAALSPELTTQYKDFLTKARAEKAKICDKQIHDTISTIAEKTGLDDAGQKKLLDAAKPAIDASLDEWTKNLDKAFHAVLTQMPGRASQLLTQIEANLPQVISNDAFIQSSPPMEQAAWKKALHDTLTADQAAAWDKVLADQKDALDKQLGPAVDNGYKVQQTQFRNQMLAECKSLEKTLNMPKDRADQLEALGQKAADESADTWRTETQKILMGLNEQMRRQVTMGGQLRMSAGVEGPTSRASWKDGLAKLLTPAEQDQLRQAGDARKVRRRQVMADLLMMLMDDKVAFTSAQREQLAPLMQRLISGSAELNGSQDDSQDESYRNYPPVIFYSLADKATDADLKPILDDTQRATWRRVPKDLQQGQQGDDDSPPAKAADKTPPSPDVAGPDEVERQISTYLYEKMEPKRRQYVNACMLKSQDAARITGLDGKSLARLNTAARGEAERAFAQWRMNVEQQARSQLQNVTPQNVKQVLTSMEDYFFQQNFGGIVSDPILSQTLKEELTPSQMEKWQKEVNARAAFHDHAISGLVLMEFDRKFHLTSDQLKQMEGPLEKSIATYWPDMRQMFSGSPDLSWFMQGPYMSMPLAGIPEQDFKAILTPEQWDAWNGSPDCANARNFWQNIQQIHRNRMNNPGQQQADQ